MPVAPITFIDEENTMAYRSAAAASVLYQEATVNDLVLEGDVLFKQEYLSTYDSIHTIINTDTLSMSQKIDYLKDLENHAIANVQDTVSRAVILGSTSVAKYSTIYWHNESAKPISNWHDYVDDIGLEDEGCPSCLPPIFGRIGRDVLGFVGGFVAVGVPAYLYSREEFGDGPIALGVSILFGTLGGAFGAAAASQR